MLEKTRSRPKHRIEKWNLQISEPERKRLPKYLRFVASLPCISCKIGGYSQAAHLERAGKGQKGCDTKVLPLCAQRPGINGCHADSEKREEAFFLKHGGIEKAYEAAQKLYETNGDWSKACQIIVKF